MFTTLQSAVRVGVGFDDSREGFRLRKHRRKTYTFRAEAIKRIRSLKLNFIFFQKGR